MAQQQVHWGHRAALWLATGFGLGHTPVVSGTVGTLAAIPIYVLLRDLGPLVYAAAVLALFVAGGWLCGLAERELGAGHDPGAVIYDEVVGYLITMFLAPDGWLWIAAGFALFRVFDIWKPFPADGLERLPGGWGVMADDAMAGVYACVALQVLAGLGNFV